MSETSKAPKPPEAAVGSDDSAAEPGKPGAPPVAEQTAEVPQPKPSKPAPPPRQLPSEEEIAGWIEGEDLPTLAALFDQLVVARFDALVMQIRKAELLPQHWQVISQRTIPDESAFDRLPEATRLRARYRDDDRAERRLAALKTAWIELGGRQPSLWTVPDLFAALRRIIDRKLEVDFHDLLSAVRDVWAGLRLPQGREQLEILWACLTFIRGKTKK